MPNVPAGQLTQLDEVVPGDVPYEPGWQVSQDVLASTAANDPVAHAVHDDAPRGLLDMKPIGHGVHVAAPERTLLNDPREHTMQPVEPGDALYWPKAQGRHADRAFAPRADDDVPIGHGWHVVEVTAPTELLYVPGVHWSHLVAPANEEYEPAAHAAHADALVAMLIVLKVPG